MQFGRPSTCLPFSYYKKHGGMQLSSVSPTYIPHWGTQTLYLIKKPSQSPQNIPAGPFSVLSLVQLPPQFLIAFLWNCYERQLRNAELAAHLFRHCSHYSSECLLFDRNSSSHAIWVFFTGMWFFGLLRPDGEGSPFLRNVDSQPKSYTEQRRKMIVPSVALSYSYLTQN